MSIPHVVIGILSGLTAGGFVELVSNDVTGKSIAVVVTSLAVGSLFAYGTSKLIKSPG